MASIDKERSLGLLGIGIVHPGGKRGILCIFPYNLTIEALQKLLVVSIVTQNSEDQSAKDVLSSVFFTR